MKMKKLIDYFFGFFTVLQKGFLRPTFKKRSLDASGFKKLAF